MRTELAGQRPAATAGVRRARALAGAILAAGAVVAAGAMPSGTAFAAVPGRHAMALTASVTGPVLEGVSCATATACTAVGAATNAKGRMVPFAERWNGRRWNVQRARAPRAAAFFWGVSCPRRTACTAVGAAQAGARGSVPLVEFWNGRRWTDQAAPAPRKDTSLVGVSCTGPELCTAVGYYANTSKTLMERDSGGRWVVQKTPASREMAAVSCVSRTSCTAAGTDTQQDFGVFSEHWNGRGWRIQANDNGSTSATVAALSCTAARACTAVGSSFYNGYFATAERWNGRRWRDESVPSPSNAQNAELNAVSCTSARACMAVGDITNYHDQHRTLAERWNGFTWKPLPTKGLAGKDSYLGDVSCTSADACTAVGDGYPATGPSSPLIERWNGHSWMIQAASPAR